jgi:denticleless
VFEQAVSTMSILNYLNQRQGLGGRRSLSQGANSRAETPWNYLIKEFVCLSEDEYIVENNLGVEIPPFGCEFSKAPSSHHILAIADEEGFIKLINTSEISDLALVKEWSAHSNAVFDLAWTETEPKLLTASGDHTIVLWDVNLNCQVSSFAGHQSTIKSVNFRRHDDNVFVSGGRDGSLMIWDTRAKGQQTISPSIVISNAHVSTSTSAGNMRKRKIFHPKGRNLLGVCLQDIIPMVINYCIKEAHLLIH